MKGAPHRDNISYEYVPAGLWLPAEAIILNLYLKKGRGEGSVVKNKSEDTH